MIQRNVLIVDDEKSIREFISVILKQEGYHTVTARNGKEALEKLKGGYFDIALVDIMMPGISGVQVLQSIKKDSPETVVVMMTGFASVETAVEALKSGAFDYITKPFELDYLRKTIKKALKSPLLNACPNITYVTDTNLRLIEANYAWDISAQAYGEEKLLFENIKGRKILDFYQGVEKKKYGEIYRELLDGTRRVYWEEYECGSEYETRFFEQKIYPLTVDGNKTGLFFVHEDVTQSRRDEEAFRKIHQGTVEANLKLQQTMEMLRNSEERYRDLFENANDLIQSVNAEGKFVYVNRKWLETIEYTDDEVKKLTLKDIIRKDQITHCMELFKRVCNGEDINQIETVFVSKNGKEIFVEGNVSAKFEKDKFVIIRGIFRDITERKRAEEQIKASLKEKEVLLKEIHHRVKNNLQVISSLLDLQSDFTEDEKILEIFNESKNRIRTMALVHEHLYQSEDLARIDISEYIGNLANYLFRSYQADQDSIELKINIEDDISLDIDKAIPCGLILNELVSNALKYAFPASAQSEGFEGKPENRDRKGEIRVCLCSDKDNKCTFIVSDNGVGLPKDLDFQNTESLGLQLVVLLVEQLGGTIELDRSSGTRFKITFPKY